MTVAVYVDTSALAKRYVAEPTSASFEAFIAASDDDDGLVINPLVLTELESVLQRRLRQHDFDASYLERTREALADDLQSGLWTVQVFDPAAFADARRLMADPATPLSTLDALHLAQARRSGCDAIATSDRQLGRAAALLGLAVHDFSE